MGTLELLSASLGAIIVLIIILQKIMVLFKSDKARASIITLMHTELERLCEQNTVLTKELNNLQQEIISLNKELRILSTENQRLNSEVELLNTQISKLTIRSVENKYGKK